jgi:hypothetical protein
MESWNDKRILRFTLVGAAVALVVAIISDDQWRAWVPTVVLTVATVVVAAININRQQRNIIRGILRRNHAELMEQAITDPDLAEVWPSRGDLSPRQRKQHLYADQILQNIFAFLATGEHSPAQARRALERAFQSPIVRDAWWAAAQERAKAVEPGTTEYAFYHLANEAYVLSETHTDPQVTNGPEYRPSPAPESPS